MAVLPKINNLSRLPSDASSIDVPCSLGIQVLNIENIRTLLSEKASMFTLWLASLMLYLLGVFSMFGRLI
uniref:Putative ovule protein n=1 Tax=Solanum chacoense TaxID=4108 RepID=A0A0V0IIS3_SOLCH